MWIILVKLTFQYTISNFINYIFLFKRLFLKRKIHFKFYIFIKKDLEADQEMYQWYLKLEVKSLLIWM